VADGPLPDGGGPTVPGTWVSVNKGLYMMGSPTTEPCRFPGEDLHQVTLTRDFAITTTEVTQEQFSLVMQRNPAQGTACGPTCPVERVSWHEAAAYCNALSARAGKAACYACTGSGAAVSCAPDAAFAGQQVYVCPGYRLPTEAEWERAYRAGTNTALYTGPFTGSCNGTDVNASKIAWCSDNSAGATHPVGYKQANAWGLFDMAGNVWEWVHDYQDNQLGSAAVTDPAGPASGTSRVYRGGSYFYAPKYLRAAYRAGMNPQGRSSDIGFRCAITQ
jgi:formylglycine-generating enzyme required for sulfatase activity